MAKKIDGPIERPREVAEARKAARRQARFDAAEARKSAAGPPSGDVAGGGWFAGVVRNALTAVLCLGAVAAALVAAFFIQPSLFSPLNAYKAEGEITAPGLKAPLTIRRDRQGVPYVFAETWRDALYGQGFALAQDRLLQMEAMRRYAAGRLSEAFGGALLAEDRMARTIGFRRMARARLKSLDAASRTELEAFAAGMNGFIEARPGDAPLELRLLGLSRVERWTPEDVLSIVYLQSWLFASPMIEAELTAQAIMERFDGDETLAEAFFPYVYNPDQPRSGDAIDKARAATRRPYVDLKLDLEAPIWGYPYGHVAGGAGKARQAALGASRRSGFAGSNNWAFTGARMGRAAALVANDPHLDIRRLPGPWHPVGLFTRDGIRAVGANVGIPGLFVGRSGDIGFGVTIGYADTADLVIETVDPQRPGRYREGGRWVEAARRREVVFVKTDKGRLRYEFTVYETPRGPLLPRTGLVGRKDKALALRWTGLSDAMAEHPSFRMEPLLRAKDSRAAIAAIERQPEASLNFVVGDAAGGVARRATGLAPRRAAGDGLTPTPAAEAAKAWNGFLSGAALPGDLEAKAGWVGSANHDVAGAAFGQTYSHLVSPSWRYRRMKELFGGDAPLDARLAELAQRDVLNSLAVALTPILVEALAEDTERRLETQAAAEILAAWDRRDEADAAAPLIFQEIVRRLAWRLYEPSLGPVLADEMLRRREFWQERFAKALTDGTGPIFDLAKIDGAIGRDVLIRQAAVEAMAELERLHGSSPAQWRWGDAMQVRFTGPIPAPEGLPFLAGPLGGGLVEISGSAETLDRAHSAFRRPDPHAPLEEVTNASSLRVVIDLADEEKILAVQAGGVTGRTLHPHLDDQLGAWAKGDKRLYWWFSEEKIREHSAAVLTLNPGAATRR